MKETVVNPELESHVEFGELTSDWLRKHKDQLNWSNVCRHQNLEDDFIDQMSQYVDWWMVSKYQLHLSEDFIRRNWNKLSIEILVDHITFTQEFIREQINTLTERELKLIVKYHELSFNFLREFKDKLPFNYVFLYQHTFKYDFCDGHDQACKEFKDYNN